MKQEKKQNKKLWLWIVIGVVALLAVAGIVLALVFGGQGEGGTTGGRAKLYWNVDRAYYTASESGLSTRVPAEDGLYYVRFACDGEQIELPVADKQLINYIDFMDIMGLTLDKDGIIVDVLNPKDVATAVGENIYVQKVDGNTIIANTSFAMNGKTIRVDMSELTELYDVTDEATMVGEIGDLSRVEPMDTISVYANDLEENTHVFLIKHTEESKVYWREGSYYNSTLKTTTRTPDENGVYSMDFFCDGERVTLQCKDVAVVSNIDYRNQYRAYCNLIFDEEGYIVDAEFKAYLGIKALLGCELSDVTDVNGDTFTATRLYNNGDGTTFTGTITEDTVIYDVSKAALAEDRQGKPVDSVQLGDRICVFTDTEGNPVMIFVACRMVESDIYYNVERSYSSTTKETTRTPNWEGYYEVELLKAGETQTRTYKCKDKRVVTLLDQENSYTVGLKLDGNEIIYAYSSECLFGMPVATRGTYVTMISGLTIQRTVYGQPGRISSSILSPECKVYNVSGLGTYGEETTLREGDRIYAHKLVTGELVCIFVTQRNMGIDTLYWNLDSQYDSDTQTTKREPDADGWYVFEMTQYGKIVKVKTKSKALADKVESYRYGMCLIVSGDIIVDVADPINATGGQKAASGYRIKSISADGEVVAYYKSGTTYKEKTFKVVDSTQYVNVSAAYYNYEGEYTSYLQIGDMVSAYTNVAGEAVVVYVRGREVDNMYWNTNRCYDSTNKVTTREPDANGWYIFELAVNGTIKTYKTKSVDVATKVDAYSSGFGLFLDGDVIRSVVPTAWVRGVGYNNFVNWDVVAINGNKITVKYNRPGSANTGKTDTFTLVSSTKVYDVSPTAKKFGAKVELKVGDTIRTYWDDDEIYQSYIYVLFHANREEGVESLCEHCGKKVYWNAYGGGSITRASGHYYLNDDVEVQYQFGVGLEDTDYEIVLDLNGKTLTRTDDGRVALVRYNDTLTIMDSVGGGALRSHGAPEANGGVMYVTDGGIVNLMGGTLELVESDLEIESGGVLYLKKSTLNMTGGTITGGEARMGGNIYATTNSQINVSGGTITGGVARDSAGNIVLFSDSMLNMSGGVMSNGYAESGRGGNIYVVTGGINISGGTITGGTDGRNRAGTVVGNAGAVATVTGGNIEDEFNLRNCKIMTIAGNPKMRKLSVESGMLVTLGKMTKGAEIYVTANGVFTKASKNAQAILDAGYFLPYNQDDKVEVYENALCVGGVPRKVYCAHCDQDVVWSPFSGGSFLREDIHYYLSSDVEVTGQLGVSSEDIDYELVLDLNGHTLTRTEPGRLLLVRFNDTLTVMDTVGGGALRASGAEGNDGGVIYVTTGHLNLMGGTIELLAGETAQDEGGVLYLKDSTFNMSGGTITGGYARMGGSIYATTNCELNVSGGTIDGGYATDSAGNIVLFSDSMLNMSGGVMSNGYAENGRGGNIYVVTGGINISGGTITGGTDGHNRAGIVVGNADAVATVSGGNIEDEFNVRNCQEVTIAGNPVMTHLSVDGGRLINLGELTEGAEIYVTANGQFTNTCQNAQAYLDADYIKPYNQGEIIEVYNDCLCVGGVPQNAVCEHCGEVVEWALWDASGSITVEEGQVNHYYLANDYNAQVEQITLRGDIVLDLNGKTYSTDGIRNFLLYGNLYIQDSAGGGVMVTTGSTKSSANTGSIAYMQGGSSLTLYSGTLKLAETHNTIANGGVLAINKGTVTVKGGEIIGGTVTGKGGALHMINYATINIEGGTVSGGSINTIGNADSNGQLNISGGTVTEEITVGDLVDVTISGKPKLSNLNLSGGKIVELGTMDEGAEVYVNAIGAFTEELTDADSYLSYFKAYVAANNVEVQDNKLTVVQGVEKTYCPHCDDNVEWLAWTFSTNVKAGTEGAIESGHYYLTADEANTKQYYVGTDSTDAPVVVDVVLDMRGNDISATTNKRTFYVYADNELTIMNTSTEESVLTSDSANAGGNLYIAGKATISNVTIVNSKTATRGNDGSILTAGSNAEIVMKDCVMTGTNATNGGAINGGSSTMTLENCTITGGTASGNGGAINKTGGSLTLTGCTIVDGTASGSGNGVYAVDTAVTVNGGNIGSLDIAGTSTLTLEGAPVISNLNIASGLTVTLGELTNGADITVTAEGAFTEANENAGAYAGYFHSNVSGKVISVENNILSVVSESGSGEPDTSETESSETESSETESSETEPSETEPSETTEATTPTGTKCDHCGEYVEWTEWDASASITVEDGQVNHYYLADHYSAQTAQITLRGNIVLDLNGKTYSTDGIRNFLLYGNLYIQDSVGGGVMVTTGSTKSNANTGSIAYMQGGSSLTLYSGTLKLAETHNTIANGGVLAINKGTVTVKGGQIIGGTVTGKGGTLHAVNYATINIEGGTVSGGTINITGKSDTELGALNISGGKITDGVTVQNYATVTLSGSPEISDIDLTGGWMLTLDQLAENASIGITADGAFTVANENAGAYAAYFHSNVADTTISVENNILSVVADSGSTEPGTSDSESSESTTTEATTEATEATTEATEPAEAYAGNAIYAQTKNGSDFAALFEGKTGEVDATCPVCNAEATWQPLAVIMNNATAKYTTQLSGHQHFYLESDVDTAYTFAPTVSSTIDGYNAEICIFLNNKSYTSSCEAFCINYSVMLNVMGDGNVTGKYTGNSNYGAVFDMLGSVSLYGGTYKQAAGSTKAIIAYRGNNATFAENAVLNIYKGTVVDGDGCNTSTIAMIRTSGYCDINMYGGELKNGYNGGTAGGANIFAQGYNAARICNINIYGGTISGGYDASGKGSIYAYGTNGPINVTIAGGTITDQPVYIGISTKSTITLTLSGTPTIEKLILEEGVTANIDGLTAGTDITVDATGAFTVASDNAQICVDEDYIKAVANKLISIVDKVLSMTEQA